MANGPTAEQARQELARREIARREAERIGQPEKAGELAKKGFIRERPGIVQRTLGKVRTVAPEVGQTAGSILGAVGGARVGAPIRGQVVGGTAGRVLGRLVKRAFGGQEIEDLTNADKKTLGQGLLQEAGTTAATELAFGTAGKMLSGAGRGALEGLLGPRVAQRGAEKGFKTLLDPKLYEGRVPKEIAHKTRLFFDKLDSVTGKAVDRVVRSKAAKGIKIKTAPIKKQADELFNATGATNIEDIMPVGASKAQINKVKMAKGMIDRVTSEELNPEQLWRIRRGLDKIRFGNKFDPDVENYLDGLRSILNKPLKSNPDIAKAFGRYQSVKLSEKDLGNKFRATLIDDEIFTPQTEQFANNLLGTSNDEKIRQLRKLDELLNAKDRVIEDLLDVAASESLEKPLQNIGVKQRMVSEALGGRKTLAGVGAAAQTPGAQVLGNLLRSGGATGVTSGLSQNQ